MVKRIRPYLFWILLVFLAVGLVYPAVGVIALTCMLAPVAVAPFRGRYWCGNCCPRGSFYDHVLAKLSPKRKIPALFSHKVFRGFMVLFIMTVFAVQMYYAWGDWTAVGKVFVQIILLTTLVGIALGLVYHQRTWCHFCPMGTLASWISRQKKAFPLAVENSCISCRLCTQICPMQLSPHAAKGSAEGFIHSDCLKCDRCVERCPKQALKFDNNAKQGTD